MVLVKEVYFYMWRIKRYFFDLPVMKSGMAHYLACPVFEVFYDAFK